MNDETTKPHEDLVREGYCRMNHDVLTESERGKFPGFLKARFNKRKIESIVFKVDDLGCDAYVKWGKFK